MWSLGHWLAQVWPISVGNPQLTNTVHGMLPQLIPTLLQNMVYSKYDYETMDAAMVSGAEWSFSELSPVRSRIA